jgi:hypothetical protein
MVDALEEESVFIEQETAFAFNRSTEGMLLFMRRAPHVKQLIEVHTLRSGWAGPRMCLKSDGPSPYQWSHSVICTWLDVDEYSAPVTICRSSPQYS